MLEILLLLPEVQHHQLNWSAQVMALLLQESQTQSQRP